MRIRHSESREGTSARQNLGELRHRESGQTTVVMTLFMATFLFGFIAIGIDVEALFHAKRQAQSAADAAAIAAAEESPQGIPAEYTAAAAAAKLNGFDTGLAVNPAVVTIHQIPLSGNYTTAPLGAYLEVIVSQPIRTFFAGVVTHKTTMVVAARAVAARDQASPTCVCLEGALGTTLKLDNGSHFNPTGCGTTVNSAGMNAMPAIPAVTVAGGTDVLGGTSIGTVDKTWDNPPLAVGLITAGTKVVMGITSSCSPPTPKVPDPSEYTAANCSGDPSTGGFYYNGSTFNLGPGSAHSITQSTADGNVTCYNSLDVGANNDVEILNPGIYIIKNGTLHFEDNGNQGGNGVTFFLVGTAKLLIDNGANVNLIAPTTGTYANVAVFLDPGDPTALPVPRAADTQPISFQGGANTSFKGEIFAPGSDISMANGSTQTIGADIVAKTLYMGGGSTLNSTPMANLGSYNISTATLTE